jgi:hypothetical protein
MIKAVCKGADGVTFVLLGLSFKNLDRLREQQLDGFIKIVGKDIGVPVDIIITAGETEQALAEMVLASGLIGPDTKVSSATS